MIEVLPVNIGKTPESPMAGGTKSPVVLSSKISTVKTMVDVFVII